MILTEMAYAKINLYLDVLGRRDDGFHDILSVMHSVSLADTLTVSVEDSDVTEITLSTSDPSLPIDESNIVYRAVREYLSYFNISAKVTVTIDKKIPIGAGLGGGSADGAATLRALNRIFRRADLDQLIALASDLGSDVAFCVLGGMSVCVSRGEMFIQLPTSEKMNFVIAIGESRVSTPKAYAALDEMYDNFKAVRNPDVHKNTHRIANMLESDILDIPNYNIFEDVIRIDEIAKIKEIMTKNGAECVLMSGSGSSVFGRFADTSLADKVCEVLIDSGYTSFVCHSVYPEVEI